MEGKCERPRGGNGTYLNLTISDKLINGYENSEGKCMQSLNL
jgi:hypothetical protein